MSATLENLEARLIALEQEMARRFPPATMPDGWKDWRQAIGRVVPGELSEVIDAGGREIREADRRDVEP